MSYDAVKAKYGYREISIATWRDPRQSVHPARGGPQPSAGISPAAASQPFIPYKVKYKPRPPPEPTDDEEEEEEEEEEEGKDPEPSIEAPKDSPLDAPQVPEEKPQEDGKVPEPNSTAPAVVEEAKEPKLEPGPVANASPSNEDAAESTDTQTGAEPPAIDPPEQDAPTVVEAAEPEVAVAETPESAAESVPPIEEATEQPVEPSQEADPKDEASVEVTETVDNPVPEAEPSERLAGEEKAEDVTAGTEQEEANESAPADLGSHIPPPAPEPPSQPDDIASVEDVGEKKVQFAPGTPEPKPTQRKKKTAKSSKGNKSRRTLLSSEDQSSPDDIVAIVEGPLDESMPPAPAPEEAAEQAVAEDGGNKAGETGGTPAAGEDYVVESAPPSAANEPVDVKPPPPEPVKAELAKSEKSSKEKSSNGKVKAVEASPVVAGLGIDLSGGSNDDPVIIDAAEPDSAVLEESSPVAHETNPTPAVQAEEAQVAAEETQPDIASSDVPGPTTESEAPIDPEPQLSPEESRDPQVAQAGESTEITPEAKIEAADAEHPVKDEVIFEASTPSENHPQTDLDEPASEDSSTNLENDITAPDQNADSECSSDSTGVVDVGIAEVEASESVVKPEEHPEPALDGEDLVDAQDALSDNQDNNSTPDSAIDIEDNSASGQDGDTQTDSEAGDDHGVETEENVEEDRSADTNEKDAVEAVALPDLSAETAIPSEEPAVIAVIDSEDPLLPVDDDLQVEAAPGESESPLIDEDAADAIAAAVVLEPAPSIEQLTNATEVGDDTDSEGEEEASSQPPNGADVPAAVEIDDGVANDIQDPESFPDEATARGDADAVPDNEASTIEEAERAAEVDLEVPDIEDNTAVDQSSSQEDTAAGAPPVAEESSDFPPLDDSPSSETGKQKAEAVSDGPVDLIEPGTDDVVLSKEISPDEPAPVHIESIESPPSNEDAAPGVVVPGTSPDIVADPPMEAVQAVAGELVEEASTDEELAAAGQDADNAAATPDENSIEKATSEPHADADAIVEEQVMEQPEVIIPSPEPERDAVAIVPDVIEVAGKEVAEAVQATVLVAEGIAQESIPPPAEPIEECPPVSEEPTEPIVPVVVPLSNASPSDPPSPKLSRSSGSKSKGGRYYIRPSKKTSESSEKSHHKKSSKDSRERTPEEIAERQRKKDARRLAESSRLLEEERRRSEEEEMRRIRHEARRAARKAAAEEVQRLAREEAEAVARREAERRRRRRESELRPRERRESDARPRERRESRSSGGLFGLGAGQSETKAGLFVRTDSGGSGRARGSRDGSGGRPRRVSPPQEEEIDDPPSREDAPKSASHEGSSRRRHRRRTDPDRAEPRRRDTTERRESERRDGERKRSSKPEKPKGFFGSLFAKF